MLDSIDESVVAGHSFTFETTLSGLGCLRIIKQWQQFNSSSLSRSIENFRHRYGPIVNAWMYFDNSGMLPQLIEWSDT